MLYWDPALFVKNYGPKSQKYFLYHTPKSKSTSTEADSKMMIKLTPERNILDSNKALIEREYI